MTRSHAQFRQCHRLIDALTAQSWSVHCSDPSVTSLEDVRRSFLKMAPEAFDFSEIHNPLSFWKKFRLPDDQLLEFWAEVWDSFDFSESHYIDFELPGDQQYVHQPFPLSVDTYVNRPRDVQMVLATFGAFLQKGGRNRVKNIVVPTALAMEADPSAVSRARLGIEGGARILDNMLKYNHG